MFEYLKKSKRGFTLIELIVVIAILAILVAVAVPTFAGITERAERSVELANAKTITTALNAHNALNMDTPAAQISDKTKWGDLPATLKPTGMPTDMTDVLKHVQYDSTTKAFYVEESTT